MKRLTPIDMKAVSDVLQAVCDKDVHRAVKYISPTLIVRATRTKNDGQYEAGMRALVHIGKPNVRERDFIKDCKKAGEKFPIRGIILQFHPEKKKKK